MAEKYRVLVVDDSLFMRKYITDLLEEDAALDVIATAENGIDAVSKVELFKPDVVTLDIEMPEMDGLTALKRIMQGCPTPVIMLSNRTKVGAYATVRALELGAIDFVAKPSGNDSFDLGKIQDELIMKVKIAARIYHRITNQPYFRVGPDKWEPEVFGEVKPKVSKAKPLSAGLPPGKIIAIGSSTGGPRALQNVLSKLPRDIPAGLAIVQHMPAGFTRTLAERLNSISQLEVMEARDGDELLTGRALLAPGDQHMKINRVGDRFFAELTDDPPISGLRPSVDVMMESLVKCQVPLMGVLLTGMGTDGLDGMKKIKEANGFTIAEDESTCVVFGMPRAAIESNCVDRIAPLDLVPQEILANL